MIVGMCWINGGALVRVRVGEGGGCAPEPLKGDADVASYGIDCSSSARRLSFFHGNIELRAE